MTNKITYLDFEEILGFELDEKVKKNISDFNLTYRELTSSERDNYILNVIDVLESNNITMSGEHRILDWENGWGENLLELRQTKKLETLIPKYHCKNKIVTIAALEQVGDNFQEFISFLLDKKPEMCIHLEPIDELLNTNTLIDNLSIKYFRKRNYLNKFLPFLENLEKNGIIEILKKQIIYSGSYFIEGHSLIVWRVKK